MARLVGLTEIAAMLGVSRQYADRLVRRPDFPQPEEVIAAGRIWLRDDVEEWARQTGRLPTGSKTPTRSVECVGGPMEGVVFDTDAPVGATVTPPGADDVVYLISDNKLASGRWGAVFRGSA